MEILLIKRVNNNEWKILSKGKYRGILYFSDDITAKVYKGKIAIFNISKNFMKFLWKYGKMPLPPYIKRSPDDSDKKTYQSIFAKKEGSIAAPTASLHFTETLMSEIKSKGVKVREITLHSWDRDI